MRLGKTGCHVQITVALLVTGSDSARRRIARSRLGVAPVPDLCSVRGAVSVTAADLGNQIPMTRLARSKTLTLAHLIHFQQLLLQCHVQVGHWGPCGCLSWRRSAATKQRSRTPDSTKQEPASRLLLPFAPFANRSRFVCPPDAKELNIASAARRNRYNTYLAQGQSRPIPIKCRNLGPF